MTVMVGAGGHGWERQIRNNNVYFGDVNRYPVYEKEYHENKTII